MEVFNDEVWFIKLIILPKRPVRCTVPEFRWDPAMSEIYIIDNLEKKRRSTLIPLESSQ